MQMNRICIFRTEACDVAGCDTLNHAPKEDSSMAANQNRWADGSPGAPFRFIATMLGRVAGQASWDECNL
jgi:hypothetical protein